MIEGLWAVRFLGVGDPTMELNGGVVVIETDRLLGGDSGYYYVGELTPNGAHGWDVKLSVQRHDSSIVSIFGDVDTIHLSGALLRGALDEYDRDRLFVSLVDKNSGEHVDAQLTKVANLP